MAKTLEERPQETTPAVAEGQVADFAAGPGPATIKVGKSRIRFNPDPGFRLLIAHVSDYGEPLSSPRFWFQNPTRPGEFDQAEYLLRTPKPQPVKHQDWWRDATPEEMAAYQEESGAFGTGPCAQELRDDWLARHPHVRVGPPPREDVETEKKRRAEEDQRMEKLGDRIGEALAKRLGNKGGVA